MSLPDFLGIATIIAHAPTRIRLLRCYDYYPQPQHELVAHRRALR
jgi:hypothetical protein